MDKLRLVDLNANLAKGGVDVDQDDHHDDEDDDDDDHLEVVGLAPQFSARFDHRHVDEGSDSVYLAKAPMDDPTPIYGSHGADQLVSFEQGDIPRQVVERLLSQSEDSGDDQAPMQADTPTSSMTVSASSASLSTEPIIIGSYEALLGEDASKMSRMVLKAEGGGLIIVPTSFSILPDYEAKCLAILVPRDILVPVSATPRSPDEEELEVYAQLDPKSARVLKLKVREAVNDEGTFCLVRLISYMFNGCKKKKGRKTVAFFLRIFLILRAIFDHLTGELFFKMRDWDFEMMAA